MILRIKIRDVRVTVAVVITYKYPILETCSKAGVCYIPFLIFDTAGHLVIIYW